MTAAAETAPIKPVLDHRQAALRVRTLARHAAAMVNAAAVTAQLSVPANKGSLGKEGPPLWNKLLHVDVLSSLKEGDSLLRYR
jgi:hypothetical protein